MRQAVQQEEAKSILSIRTVRALEPSCGWGLIREIEALSAAHQRARQSDPRADCGHCAKSYYTSSSMCDETSDIGFLKAGNLLSLTRNLACSRRLTSTWPTVFSA